MSTGRGGGARPNDGALLLAEAEALPVSPPLPAAIPVPAISRPAASHRARPRWRAELGWPLAVYAGTRLLLIAVALAVGSIFPAVTNSSISFGSELGNWDGWWYIRLATFWYPPAVVHGETTLGFFPAYSLAMWLVAHLMHTSYEVAGLVISAVGGLVATVLVQRLATEWWGRETARRAVVLFCLFPGSVVFSMDYSEGILIPLAIGCVLALSHRRFLLAGCLAGLATAVGPDALSLVALTAVASLLQLWRYGWRDAGARRSLVAPLLAPVGIVAFGLYLKEHTGSFFASFTAQRFGWHESTTLLAVPRLFVQMADFAISRNHGGAGAQVKMYVGTLGFVMLVAGGRWLWQERARVGLPVLAFVAAMGFLMVTSANVPPNPRMLITAFPVVLVFAQRFDGRSYRVVVVLFALLLMLLSALTFGGRILTP